MKKVVCFIISVLLVFCLVSCDTGSGSNGPTKEPSNGPANELTATELMALVNQKEQAGYGEDVIKMTMDMVADTTISGTTSQIKQSMEMYMKESAANSVASVKTTVELPGEDNMVSEQYYANGYLYTANNGVTYKKQSLFEAITGANSMSSGDMNDLLKGSKDTKVEVQTDGSYKITLDVDPQSDNALVEGLLEGIGATGTGVTLKTITSEFIVGADYFLNTMKIYIDLSAEMAGAGVVDIKYNVTATAQNLGAEYEITVPESIDVENAVVAG